MFVALTYAGTFGIVWLVLGAAIAVHVRRPWIFVGVVTAVLVADLASRGLKEAVDRARPEQALGVDTLVRTPDNSSFPSSHAATSFAAAIVLAVAVPRRAPFALALAACIAFSRLYVGVHFPLDVLAGATLGVLVATALLLLARSRTRER